MSNTSMANLGGIDRAQNPSQIYFRKQDFIIKLNSRNFSLENLSASSDSVCETPLKITNQNKHVILSLRDLRNHESEKMHSKKNLDFLNKRKISERSEFPWKVLNRGANLIWLKIIYNEYL